MTEEEYGKVSIGEDKPQIEPKTVVVEKWEIVSITKEDKEIGKKVVLSVRHPDVSDRLIEISGAKYQMGDKLKASGIWWKLDGDGKIPYKSAIANVLRHCNVETLHALKGVQVETVVDEQGYLLIKAY